MNGKKILTLCLLFALFSSNSILPQEGKYKCGNYVFTFVKNGDEWLERSAERVLKYNGPYPENPDYKEVVFEYVNSGGIINHWLVFDDNTYKTGYFEYKYGKSPELFERLDEFTSHNLAPEPIANGISTNTSKNSIYGKYNFGIICDGKVFIDETHEYNNYESARAIKYDKLWKKYSGHSKRLDDGYDYIMFNSLLKEFSGNTSFQNGDGAYISTVYGVFETKLTGYALMAISSGAKLYDVFNLSKSFQNYKFGYNDAGENNNYVVLSTSSNISGINNKTVTNENIEKYLKTFRKKLVFVKGMGHDNFNETSEEIRVFSINIDSEKKGFVSSYTYRYEGIYANAVYIFNENNKILRTIKAFEAPNKNDLKEYNYTDFGEYYTVLGTIDVNFDGVDEVIIRNSYYEGGSYELWGYEDGGFIMITNGIVEGT